MPSGGKTRPARGRGRALPSRGPRLPPSRVSGSGRLGAVVAAATTLRPAASPRVLPWPGASVAPGRRGGQGADGGPHGPDRARHDCPPGRTGVASRTRRGGGGRCGLRADTDSPRRPTGALADSDSGAGRDGGGGGRGADLTSCSAEELQALKQVPGEGGGGGGVARRAGGGEWRGGVGARRVWRRAQPVGCERDESAMVRRW